jgi:ABC-2 type transport system ATP-binding protein
MNLIETYDLCKRYGSSLVIDHVNMHVPEKAVYGFVGENGSGKTTIMRLVSGLASPTSGEYSLFGVSSKDRAIHKVRKNISAIVEMASLVPSLTALENMRYQELYIGINQTDEERMELLRKVHLEEVGNKKVRNYSLGMRQRLAIALALMNKPKLMLLDEPMNGLDPEGIAELRELLIDLNQKEGITVLISSHILSELEKIASCYGFISHGKLLEEITTEELQNRCKKSLNLKVADLAEAQKILAKLGAKDVKVYPSGEIKIYDDIKVNKVVVAFDKAGVELLGVNSSEESVEDYYLNLVKGGK